MTRRSRAIVAAVVAVGVLAGLMVVVAGVLRVGPFARDGAVQEALAVLPAGTDHVVVGDRAGAAERLGVPDDEGDDEDGEVTVRDEAPWASSPLTGSVPAGGDAPVRDADVAWWAIADGIEFGDSTVLGLTDDVDMDRLVADLGDAGYVEAPDGDASRPTLTLELGGADPTAAALPWSEVSLDLDERLLLAGDPDAVVAVLDGSATSLADAGTYDGVLDGHESSELALLDTASSLCDAALGARATPEGEAEASAELDGLGRPEAAGTFLSPADGDDDAAAGTASRLRFDDEGTAEADAVLRESYLAGTDLSDVSVASDGDVVTVDFTYPGPGVVLLRQEALQRTTPTATRCPPGE